jgi:ribosomal protein S18 acetylase RimI-like enzyme
MQTAWQVQDLIAAELVQEVLDLSHSVWPGEQAVLDMLQSELQQNVVLLTAWAADRLVGFILARRSSVRLHIVRCSASSSGEASSGKACSLCSLVVQVCLGVHPQSRRQGCGQALMKALVTRAEGCSCVSLVVAAQNTAAIALCTYCSPAAEAELLWCTVLSTARRSEDGLPC